MMGIYCFTNKINNKKYIGQSKNLEKRKKTHYRNYNNINCHSYNSHFYKALRKWGIENFIYEILCEKEYFSQEKLNELEIYYIKIYDSYNNGYNMNLGGNYTSGDKKLNMQQIYEIYKLIKKETIPLTEIAKLYSIEPSLLSIINQGIIWKQPNYQYPIRKNTYFHNIGGNNPNAKITDELAIEIRNYFVDHTLTEVYNKYNTIPFSSLKKLVYGTSFQHLPIYKKRKEQWFLDGSCIDYLCLKE